MTIKALAFMAATAAICGTFAVVPAALAQPFTVTHAQGELTLDAVPAKIFTFDVASLDTLDALGIEVAGVAGANFPEHLKKYGGAEYLQIGSLFEPNYELIDAEQPDLIIVAGRSSAAYEQLSKVAPTIDLSVDSKDFLGSVVGHSRTIAEIFGKQAEAEALIGALHADVETVRARASEAGNALVVLTIGSRMSAFGGASRFGWLHDELGLVQAMEKVATEGNQGEAISFDDLLEINPDWFFVIDRNAAVGGNGGEAANEVLNNSMVQQTKTFQNGQVVYLDPTHLYIVNGGLGVVQRVVDQVGEAIGADLD